MILDSLWMVLSGLSCNMFFFKWFPNELLSLRKTYTISVPLGLDIKQEMQIKTYYWFVMPTVMHIWTYDVEKT